MTGQQPALARSRSWAVPQRVASPGGQLQAQARARVPNREAYSATRSGSRPRRSPVPRLSPPAATLDVRCSNRPRPPQPVPDRRCRRGRTFVTAGRPRVSVPVWSNTVTQFCLAHERTSHRVEYDVAPRWFSRLCTPERRSCMTNAPRPGVNRRASKMPGPCGRTTV